jgi:hypothetical protein
LQVTAEGIKDTAERATDKVVDLILNRRIIIATY